MRRYLDAYQQILPPFEQKALASYLGAFAPDVSGSEEDQKARIQALLSAIEQDRRIYVAPRLMQGQLSSRDYNANWQEILTDLHTLYRRTKNLEATLANHEAIAHAAIARIDREIRALEAKIEALAIANDRFGGFAAAWVENFASSPRMEISNTVGYFDPQGLASATNFRAQVDPLHAALALPVRYSVSASRDDTTGLTTALLEIVEMSGEAFRDADPRFGPQNALDGDMDSVWAEVILSDGVFRIPFILYPGSAQETVFDRGAWVLLRLTFASSTPVNSLHLVPYGPYPMELLWVGYGTTLEEPFNVPARELFLGPLSLPVATRIAFPQKVHAQCLYLLLRQLHAVHHTYTVSEDALRARSFWQAATRLHRELLAAEWALASREIQSAALTTRLESLDVAWQAYLQAAEQYAASWQQGSRPVEGAEQALAELAGLATKRPKQISVERYEYDLGLRELGARYTEYEQAGIYVSPPIELPANAIEVMLEVEEDHPWSSQWGMRKARDSAGNIFSLDGVPERRTSVEYWVAAGESPGNDEWYPVLPAGTTWILDERLVFSGTPAAATTRFPIKAGTVARLYADHQPVELSSWSIDEWDDDQGHAVIKLTSSADSNTVYTIDYIPDTSDVLSFLEKRRNSSGDLNTTRRMEHFPGADRHYSVQLTYVPWVNRDKLEERDAQGYLSYNPVQVTLNKQDAPGRQGDIHRIQVGETAITDPISSTRDPNQVLTTGTGNVNTKVRLLNVTRYQDEDLPVMDPYDPMAANPTFQYFHVGRKVYFTEDFRSDGPEANYGTSHGNAIITVEYDTFVTHVRVKAILRNNDKENLGLTPQIRKLVLKVRTL